MRKILAVAVKEIRQIGRDPLTLMMLLGVPAFMLVVFGYALSFDVENVPLAVEDRDLSRESRDLAAAFVQSRRFALAGQVEAGADPEALLARGKAGAVLIIPEGFSRDLKAGRSAAVQVIIDGTDASRATTILSHAVSLAGAAGSSYAARAPGGAGRGAVLDAAVRFEPRVLYNPELASSLFLVPGLIGFIAALTAVLSTALSVVRERERGSMEQLRTAPVRTFQVLLGKTAPYLAISLVAVVLILGAARVLFDVEIRGSYTGLAAATVLFLLAALAWGLFISTLADSQAAAFQMGLITSMLPSLILSGFVFPIRNMPEALQVVTYAVPARYYLAILRGVALKGSGLGPFRFEMGCMALYTVVVLALASIRFARKGG